MSTAVAQPTTIGRAPRDLSMFREGMEWDGRVRLMARIFAGAPLMEADSEAAWLRAFDRDIELMGRVLRDILKSQQTPRGRSGPRPALNTVKAEPQVDEWLGRDYRDRPYSLLPFAEAFAVLARGLSRAEVAAVVGMPRTQVHRLLVGSVTPTREMMVKVAKAFDKEPGYFVEYRIEAIAAALLHKLSADPEHSVRFYEVLFW